MYFFALGGFLTSYFVYSSSLLRPDMPQSRIMQLSLSFGAFCAVISFAIGATVGATVAKNLRSYLLLLAVPLAPVVYYVLFVYVLGLGQ